MRTHDNTPPPLPLVELVGYGERGKYLTARAVRVNGHEMSGLVSATVDVACDYTSLTTVTIVLTPGEVRVVNEEQP